MASPEYQKYLASREWAVRKEAVKKRAGGICERCLQRPLQSTHHLTYERIYNEPLKDLLGVCNPCHEFLSGKSSVDPDGSELWFVYAIPMDRLEKRGKLPYGCLNTHHYIIDPLKKWFLRFLTLAGLGRQSKGILICEVAVPFSRGDAVWCLRCDYLDLVVASWGLEWLDEYCIKSPGANWVPYDVYSAGWREVGEPVNA